MKKQILMAALILISCFGYSSHSQAQVSVSFGIGAQPLWGPVGYSSARYYYIPDIGAYYDVANQDYVYLDNGVWITSATLPAAYSNFDLYGAHKVVINTPRPWLRDNYYSRTYAGYRGRHDQVAIRDSRDQRYWANPQHPMHENWHGNMGREEHRSYGGYRPHDNGDHGDRGHGHEDHGR